MDLSEIIEGCCEGNEKCQRKLYELYAPLVMRTCRRYTQSVFEADDVLQEAFVNIFQNIETYGQNEGKNNFDGWVYRITVNAALKYLRKHLKKQAPGNDPVEETAYGEVVIPDHLSVEELQELIDQLPVGQKTIFNLFAVDGYSHEEIADMLDISIGTSRSQLKRARETLQEYHQKVNQLHG